VAYLEILTQKARCKGAILGQSLRRHSSNSAVGLSRYRKVGSPGPDVVGPWIVRQRIKASGEFGLKHRIMVFQPASLGKRRSRATGVEGDDARYCVHTLGEGLPKLRQPGWCDLTIRIGAAYVAAPRAKARRRPLHRRAPGAAGVRTLTRKINGSYLYVERGPSSPSQRNRRRFVVAVVNKDLNLNTAKVDRPPDGGFLAGQSGETATDSVLFVPSRNRNDRVDGVAQRIWHPPFGLHRNTGARSTVPSPSPRRAPIVYSL